MSRFFNNQTLFLGALTFVVLLYIVNEPKKTKSLQAPKNKSSVGVLVDNNAPIGMEVIGGDFQEQLKSLDSRLQRRIPLNRKVLRISIVPTPADGDCFFTALEKAFPKRDYVAKEMREIASSKVSAENYADAKEAYLVRKMVGDPEMMRDVAYMRPAVELAKSDKHGLKILQSIMRSKRLYWADELVYPSMESYIRADIHVLQRDPMNRKKLRFMRQVKPAEMRYKNNIILLLDHYHYELIKINGKTQFTNKEIWKIAKYLQK